jgi:ribonuclease E
MTKRMLVDATHGEETRVAVVSGNRLEELDFEIASRRQLKGNIYLAKVIRVEPSLQAAFVEYGGNRHGFLAFSEIHPDYYRIPVEDRAALLAEEERLAAAEARRYDAMAEAEERAERRRAEGRAGRYNTEAQAEQDNTEAQAEQDNTEAQAESTQVAAAATPVDALSEAAPAPVPALTVEDEFGLLELVEPLAQAGDVDGEVGEAFDEAAEVEETVGSAEVGEALNGEILPPSQNGDDEDDDEEEDVDVVGGDEGDDSRRHRPRPLRSYKIQEVIKRRQILLVQVTKEERGNKGAALTTYLSLPGRYCVLMPNTGRGGGISRKITNPADRRRLKDIMSDLDIPGGMAVILRTAGLERAKPEIKRDLEYLLRLWDDIREQTLKSVAPTLIYEEANLIKRAIRDVYADDIEEIWVDGEAGYRTAQNFMRMMMPSHTGRVQLYRDQATPLFHRYQVEQQIDAIHSPIVQLRSGGYIVINPTEALVAIDVNSGRSTRERNIEETAFKTNLEAAEEVARQLRLRDLAGLIVIDFIDMEDGRNNAAVERRLKEAMKNDRARIQVGRISTFGLMELSRQRLRPSLQETNFERCPHCEGTGVVRSVESAALKVLRAIADEGLRRRAAEVLVYAPTRVVLYILNQKRADLSRLETLHNFRVAIANDDTLIGAETMRIERMRVRTAEDDNVGLVSAERILEETDRDLAAEEDAAEETGGEEPAEIVGESAEAAESRRRRRRRRRGGREERDNFTGRESEVGAESEDVVAAAAEPGAEDADGETGEAGENGAEETTAEAGGEERGGDRGDRRNRRRRGRRGGRRERFEEGAEAAADAPQPVIRAVLPPAESVTPLEPIDFDLILDGEVPVAAAPEIVLDAVETPAPAPVIVEAAQVVEVVETVEAAAEVVETAETPVAKPKGRGKKTADAGETVEGEEAPAKPSRKRKAKAADEATDAAPASAEEAAGDAAAKPARKRKTKAKAEDEGTDAAPASAEEAGEAQPKPSRKRKTKAKAEDEAVDAPPAPAQAEAVEPAEVAETAETAEAAQAAAVEAAAADKLEAENAAARAAEVINQPPAQPKRGYWRR